MFDFEDWKRRLYELNPWANELAPAHDLRLSGIDPFAQARLQAALVRWHAGRERWNAWANAMLDLRKKLEAAGLWEKDQNKAVEEQLLFLHHSVIEFDNLCLPGEVNFLGFVFPGRISFQQTRFGDKVTSPGGAWFDSAQFHGGAANFSGAQFHGGEARFDGAQFHGGAARFDGAEFCYLAESTSGSVDIKNARFYRAANNELIEIISAQLYGKSPFEGMPLDDISKPARNAVDFRNAIFFHAAIYEHCKINIPITFAHAQFIGDATFTNARFNEQATFEDALFKGDATFKSINSKTGFTLSGADFERVPDFTQSSFHRHPRVDDVVIGHIFVARLLKRTLFTLRTPLNVTPPWPENMMDAVLLRWGKRDKNAPAKFRELKHFAMEGKDGRSELNFHAEEIRSARWVKDWPWHPGFWLGYLYGIFSNFGRSILRPFLIWLATIVVFTCIYLSAHIDNPKMPNSGTWSGWSRPAIMTWTALWNTSPCTTGKGNNIIGLKEEIREGTSAFSQAVRMSLANAVVFGDLGGVEGTRLAYGCLFGLERLEPYGVKPEDKRGWFTTTYLPSGMLWAMRVQKAFSAMLIFLFSLGLRNMLKLK